MENHSARRGRPRLDICLSPDRLRSLGRAGLDLEGTASVLGCSRRVLSRRMAAGPELERAYREGVDQFRAFPVCEIARARFAVLCAERTTTTAAE